MDLWWHDWQNLVLKMLCVEVVSWLSASRCTGALFGCCPVLCRYVTPRPPVCGGKATLLYNSKAGPLAWIEDKRTKAQKSKSELPCCCSFYFLCSDFRHTKHVF